MYCTYFYENIISFQGTDEAKRAGLKEYVTRAKQYLGLSIARTSTDSYILTFTNIDNRDLQRQFLCEIRVSGENKRSYKGTSNALCGFSYKHARVT